MRSELSNTYTYLDDGGIGVRARTPQGKIIEYEVGAEELGLDIQYPDGEGKLHSGRLRLRPVVSRVTRLDDKLNPLQIKYLAARVCYNPIQTEGLIEQVKDASVGKMRLFLRQKIIKTGHHSILEHPSGPCFLVEGISRVESHQDVRHRLRSYSQESQRFVDLADQTVQGGGEASFSFIVPPSIRADCESMLIHIASVRSGIENYHALRCRGILPEDARYDLNNAAATRMVVSCNDRAWMEFFPKRTCAKAQWETDITATEIARQIWQAEPVYLDLIGPDCSAEGCRQGRRTCGAPLREPLGEIFSKLKPGDPYPHDHLIFGMR